MPTAQVLGVLGAAGVAIYPQAEDPSKLVLTKGDVIYVSEFGDLIPRGIVNKLARKFDVPIHLIYNPQLMKH